MQGLRDKLSSLKVEEADLSDKLAALDESIRSARKENDSLQYELQSLQSSEQLLKIRMESAKSRLSTVEKKLISHQHMALSAEEEMSRMIGNDSNESDLENELSKKREELRSIEAQYDEIVIHTQQILSEKKRKEDRASALERDLARLKSENEKIQESWKKAESYYSPDDVIAELETRVKDFQSQLDQVNTTLEQSQREITRLDRLISGCKDNLAEERRVHEQLKREFDNICSELESM